MCVCVCVWGAAGSLVWQSCLYLLHKGWLCWMVGWLWSRSAGQPPQLAIVLSQGCVTLRCPGAGVKPMGFFWSHRGSNWPGVPRSAPPPPRWVTWPNSVHSLWCMVVGRMSTSRQTPSFRIKRQEPQGPKAALFLWWNDDLRKTQLFLKNPGRFFIYFLSPDDVKHCLPPTSPGER